MSVQVRRRREAAAFLSTYVGAQGELLVDTTNNRVQVHDGTTPGGWPAAKLADVIGRTAVADAAYTAKASDRTIAFTSLTAPRTVTLPAAATYPTGTVLTIVDESGACATLAISVAAAGTDTVNGLAAWPIASAFGYAALESNGVGRWTVVDAPGTARTAVADAAYTALATDRTIAFTALTTARTVTLPSASAYPTGTQLVVVDESGQCAATRPLTLSRAGTDTINGAASAVLTLAYGYLALASDGVSKWTVLDQSTASMAQQAASAVAITGGTINGAAIGQTTPAAGTFTTVAATTGTVQAGPAAAVQGSAAGPTLIAAGTTTPTVRWFNSTASEYFEVFLNTAGVTYGRFVNGAYSAGATVFSVASDTNSRPTTVNWYGTAFVVAGALSAASLDSTPIGQTTPAAVSATALSASGAANITGSLTMGAPIGLKSYTVATLPAAGTVGRVVHCSNARMFNGAGVQEASGAGTGGTVTDNGSAWKLAGTNSSAIS